MAFAQPKGLGNVVVGAGFQRAHLVFLRILNGDHYNARSRHQGSDPLARFKSINAGHVDVQQHEIEDALPDRIQSLFPASGFFHREAAGNKGCPQRLPQGGFVIDNQNSTRRRQHGQPALENLESSGETSRHGWFHPWPRAVKNCRRAQGDLSSDVQA